jgi:hypothetical protein
MTEGMTVVEQVQQSSKATGPVAAAMIAAAGIANPKKKEDTRS